MSEEQKQYITENNEEEKYHKKEWKLEELIKSCHGVITQEECIHKVHINSSNSYVYVVSEKFYMEAVRRNHQIISMLEKAR